MNSFPNPGIVNAVTSRAARGYINGIPEMTVRSTPSTTHSTAQSMESAVDALIAKSQLSHSAYSSLTETSAEQPTEPIEDTSEEVITSTIPDNDIVEGFNNGYRQRNNARPREAFAINVPPLFEKSNLITVVLIIFVLFMLVQLYVSQKRLELMVALSGGSLAGGHRSNINSRNSWMPTEM